MAVESTIPGILPFWGMLLPIAPRKASRTPSSTLATRSNRSVPSSSSFTTLWVGIELGVKTVALQEDREGAAYHRLGAEDGYCGWLVVLHFG